MIDKIREQLIEEIKKELLKKENFTISDFYKIAKNTMNFPTFQRNVELEEVKEENITELSLEEVGNLLNDLNDTDGIEYFIKNNKIYMKENNTDVYKIK